MYTCPMHREISMPHKGKCPKCGMDLVKVDGESSIAKYAPLIVIFVLITTMTFLISVNDLRSGAFSLENSMRYFMAAFFFVFSGFKLFDLKGFKEGYQTYDLLAQKVPTYGYIYPFIELALGAFYILNFNPLVTNLLTFIIMSFSGVGVVTALLEKKHFTCACLGTFLKIPLTKVTLVEDFGMASMAIFMLVA